MKHDLGKYDLSKTQVLDLIDDIQQLLEVRDNS